MPIGKHKVNGKRHHLGLLRISQEARWRWSSDCGSTTSI